MVEPLACVLRGNHETGIQPGDTTVLIGCGPIGLKFIRMLACRGVNVIALGKRPNQMRAAERMGARAAFDVSKLSDPVQTVRRLTEGGRGADSVIEAVGRRSRGNGRCRWCAAAARSICSAAARKARKVQFDPTALHYSEITIKSTFHHTPRFIREALERPFRAAKSAPATSSTLKFHCASCRPCSST